MNKQYRAGWGIFIILLLFVAGLIMNFVKVAIGIINIVSSDNSVTMDMALPVIMRFISLFVPFINSVVGYF